jgi:AraC family transcriptional regulator
MMSVEPPLVLDVEPPSAVKYDDWVHILARQPLLSSFQAGWSSIQLAHCHLPSVDLPEIANAEHILTIPLGHRAIDLEFFLEGGLQTVSYQERDFANGCIEFVPADLPLALHSHTSGEGMELIQCHLEPTFLAQIAHESVNPDRVELVMASKTVDLLLCQLALALKSSLEEDGVGSRLYADSMATAMSAHLLRYYATRNHRFTEYEDGLSQQKLRQALDYIQAHLSENLSLSEIADKLGMSQYYFCHLFKRSTGMSPHQYLIRQRVERAKHLLRQTELTITSIALKCGFANQSHFAKSFRQYTGLNPKEFRNS